MHSDPSLIFTESSALQYVIFHTFSKVFLHRRESYEAMHHLITWENMKDYRDHPYDALEQKDLSLLQNNPIFSINATLTSLDNTLCFSGTSICNITLPKAATLIRFESDFNHSSSERLPNHKKWLSFSVQSNMLRGVIKYGEEISFESLFWILDGKYRERLSIQPCVWF